jgi:hypothetical protein
MTTLTRSHARNSRALPLPLETIEAAHAACEIDEDGSPDKDQDPIGAARGIITSLGISLVAGATVWLATHWLT